MESNQNIYYVIYNVIKNITGVDIKNKSKEYDFIICKSVYYYLCNYFGGKPTYMSKYIGFTHGTACKLIRDVEFELKKTNSKRKDDLINLIEQCINRISYEYPDMIGLKIKKNDFLYYNFISDGDKLIYQTNNYKIVVKYYINNQYNVHLLTNSGELITLGSIKKKNDLISLINTFKLDKTKNIYRIMKKF